MAGRHAQFHCDMWDDPDFTALSRDAQRMFMFLLSQRKMNMVGLLPFTPRAWRSRATDLTQDIVDDAIEELRERRFIVIDEDTVELLVRTVVTHDPPRGAKSIPAAWRAFKQIESANLRSIVYDQMPSDATDHAEAVKDQRNAPCHEAENGANRSGKSESGMVPVGAGVRPPTTDHLPPSTGIASASTSSLKKSPHTSRNPNRGTVDNSEPRRLNVVEVIDQQDAS